MGFISSKRKSGVKSPLKARPHRNPGHSLDEEINDQFLDRVIQPLTVAFGFVFVAMFEWWRWYFDVSSKPGLFTLAAAAAVGYFLFALASAQRRLRPLKLGRDGERAVGQFLETLRALGAHVFHDFPGEGFNIDHIVVHASGIYVVETKTYSKPDRGDVRIVFDGAGVLVNGHAPDRNPVTQVQAGARWLSNLVRESTGRSFPVQPVVVFPGWYVDTVGAGVGADVLAIEPKQLQGIVRAGARIIADSDVAMAALHLSRYARAVEAQRQ